MDLILMDERFHRLRQLERDDAGRLTELVNDDADRRRLSPIPRAQELDVAQTYPLGQRY